MQYLKLLCDFISSVKWQKTQTYPKRKGFVTRELSKGMTTLTKAKVLQRDYRKIKRYITTSQQRHKKRVLPQL